MSDTPLGQILGGFRQVHQDILKFVEELPDEQWAWQPHSSANSTAFYVWHLARWADYVQARLPEANPQLSQRLATRRQVWYVESLAAQWHLDPARLGEYEAGTEMGAASAQMRLPDKAVLIDYLRRCYALQEEALAVLDDELFQTHAIRQIDRRLGDGAFSSRVGTLRDDEICARTEPVECFRARGSNFLIQQWRQAIMRPTTVCSRLAFRCASRERLKPAVGPLHPHSLSLSHRR